MGMVEIREIMAIAWAIWFCRKKFVYAQESLCGETIATCFLVVNYCTFSKCVYRSITNGTTQQVSSFGWKGTFHGAVKVNVDAQL